MSKKPAKRPVKCDACKKPTSSDHHCFGCKSTYCEECDKGHPCLPRGHKPEDHLREWCPDCCRFEEDCLCEK